tara:strand:+ start:6175 stop:6735 length:561 start_codon:yes stop_codon:yes gene_type:complete
MNKIDTNLEVIINELDKNEKLITQSVSKTNASHLKIIEQLKYVNNTDKHILKETIGLKKDTNSSFNSIEYNLKVINENLIKEHLLDYKINKLYQNITTILKERFEKLSSVAWSILITNGVSVFILMILNVYLISQMNALSTKLETNYDLGYSAGKQRAINYFNEYLEKDKQGKVLFQKWEKENKNE